MAQISANNLRNLLDDHTARMTRLFLSHFVEMGGQLPLPA
jgi:hypothetical protein